MTEHLDDAVERARSLAERLDDTRQADRDLRVTEDEIENRLEKIEEAVKLHNESLQHREGDAKDDRPRRSEPADFGGGESTGVQDL